MELKAIIESKTDLSDSFAIEFRNKHPSSKEYDRVLRDRILFNKTAYELLNFFCVHDKGDWRPEKCGGSEPLKRKFDCGNLATYTDWLSYPAGAVFLKKMKPFPYSCMIENERFGFIWEEDGTFLKPVALEPEVFSKITFFIKHRYLKHKSRADLDVFLGKLMGILNTDMIEIDENYVHGP